MTTYLVASNKKWIVWQFWRPEAEIKESAGLASSGGSRKKQSHVSLPASGAQQQPLVCTGHGRVTVTSASLSPPVNFFPLCLSESSPFLKRTPTLDLGPTLSYCDLISILNYLHLSRSYFQIRSHSKIPGGYEL